MSTWPRRLSYLLLLLAWLVLISLPFAAFSLAARGQFEFGDPQRTYLRIFVLQEKEAEGIGLEFARPNQQNPACRQTDVRYFMWSGTGQDVTFCQCLDQQGRLLSAVPGSCRVTSPP